MSKPLINKITFYLPANREISISWDLDVAGFDGISVSTSGYPDNGLYVTGYLERWLRSGGRRDDIPGFLLFANGALIDDRWEPSVSLREGIYPDREVREFVETAYQQVELNTWYQLESLQDTKLVASLVTRKFLR